MIVVWSYGAQAANGEVFQPWLVDYVTTTGGAVVPPTVTEPRGGAGGYRRHGRKSWWVLVGDERHKVTSKAEEQALVLQYIQTKEQELAVALAGTETTKAKGIRISLTRAIQRMERVKAEAEQERIKRLMDDDEEILFILSLH